MQTRRAQKQLALIEEFVALCESEGIAYWLRGGWALDFLVGKVTRAHGDIDFFIWAVDLPRLHPVLIEHEYDDVGGPPPEQQRNLIKADEEFHVTLLERNERGVVTAGGRWADSPWPIGMLDGPVGGIGRRSARVISAGAQLWAKEEVPKALGRPPRPYDHGDIALLREVLAEDSSKL